MPPPCRLGAPVDGRFLDGSHDGEVSDPLFLLPGRGRLGSLGLDAARLLGSLVVGGQGGTLRALTAESSKALLEGVVGFLLSHGAHAKGATLRRVVDGDFVVVEEAGRAGRSAAQLRGGAHVQSSALLRHHGGRHIDDVVVRRGRGVCLSTVRVLAFESALAFVCG